MRLAPALVLLLVLASSLAHARDAKVTAITPTTIYIDAGTADGLAAGATWQVTLAGRTAQLRVAAAASHDAVVELDGPPPPVGTLVPLPARLAPPPSPAAPRPPPAALPAWRDQPVAIEDVRRAAEHEQPPPVHGDGETRVSGELALTALVAGFPNNASTGWNDIGLTSQLTIEQGPWRYDHLLDLHLAGSPEVFIPPLQGAQARFDVYLLRLQYAPIGAGYALALGRQPGAPLGELGTIDGGRARFDLARGVDATMFAGLRPASDLALSLAPRAGGDVGWSYARSDGTRARADAGVAIDEYKGALDRALVAVSGSYANRRDLAHADATFDLTTDEDGRAGPRVTRVNAFVRARRGKASAELEGGYDRPFLDRALAAEAPIAPDLNLALGPRSYAGLGATYALRTDVDLGTTARVSRGDGFTSGYLDATASWYSPGSALRVSAAPHAVIGTLVDEFGLRGALDIPMWAWWLDLAGSLDRVYAGGATAWAGIGRLSGSRAFLRRWRTSLAVEVGGGDGPPRVLMFALLGYRFGN